MQFFLYAGCKDEEEYRSILPEIQRINRDVFKIVTATLTFLMLVLIITSSFYYFYFDYSINYVLIFALSSLFSFVVWSLPENNTKLSQALLYLFIILSYFFGTINGVILPNQTAVGFIVTLITLPLLFIDRPIRIVFSSLTAMAFFALAVIITKPYVILIFDVTNVIVYGFFGLIISNHIVYVKVSKLLADKKLRIMSETDLLTGLRNRNSYEENLPLYPSRVNKLLTCIYMDANGLHELNNTKGHKAGDELLCTIAKFLQSRFYGPDIYRIGGDEFVVFVIDDLNDSSTDILNEISFELEQLNYHVSWGISSASAHHLDMNSLILEAEQKMYKSKSLYYQLRGIDRRRSRK